MLVCVFYSRLCTRDRGCSAHPVFPAPLLKGRPRPSWDRPPPLLRVACVLRFSRGECLQNPGARRRGIANLCPCSSRTIFRPTLFRPKIFRPAIRVGPERAGFHLGTGAGRPFSDDGGADCTESVHRVTFAPKCRASSRVSYNLAMKRNLAFGSARARIACLIRRKRPAPR
jgi:hypothetical protein